MKLNFWQWLGLILLVIGLALWLYRKNQSTATDPGTAPQTIDHDLVQAAGGRARVAHRG